MTNTSPLRILIVEDVLRDADLAARELQRAGIVCQTRVVQTREDLLRELEDFGPQLILSDYSMPKLTGMEALELRNKHAPDVPFIVVTAAINEQTAVGCIKHGADDYVTKDRLIGLPHAVASGLEKKRLERVERQSQEQTRLAARQWNATFDALRDGVLLLDREGRVLRCNAALTGMLGRPAEEILGRSCCQLIHGVAEPPRECPVRRAAGSLRRESWQTRVGERWFDLVADPILDPDGRVTGTVHMLVDVTERREAERALQASEEKHRLLFETSRDALLILAPPSWKFASGNPAAVQMFRARDEAHFTSSAPWECSPERQPDGSLSADQARVMIDMALRDGAHSFSWTHRRLDGEDFPATVTLTRFELGGQSQLQATVRDVSEQKRLEAERDALEAQLHQAQKLEAVGRLAGGVAHDFNNLLSVILGYAELALDKTSAEAPLRNDLQQIITAGECCRDIARQLLVFARRQVISPKVLDLNSVVAGMLQILQRLIGEDLELVWQPGHGLRPLWMDASQLDQILANLCVNARDAIADVGKITVRTEHVVVSEADTAAHAEAVPGEYGMLAVSDDGCGMGPEILDKIFEPFFTTKGPGKGTGLGLSTVYGIVKQNRGFIGVHSQPGQGTTFEIYLPAHAPPAGEVRTPSELPFPRGRGETVLLVEDDPLILKLVGISLTKLGYRVRDAASPGAALRLAQRHGHEIQLLLTDVIMPEMNGRELADRLRALNPRLKQLFMSGYTADIIADRGVLETGVHVIHKPFSTAELAIRVAAALQEPPPPTVPHQEEAGDRTS